MGCVIHWYESAMGLDVFLILNSPSTSHPSGSSPCTSPEHPASCIKHGLAICFTYDNTQVSMLFSDHPTLAFSHRVQKTVLCICVSFAILHTGLSFLYRILFVSKLPSFHSHLTHEDHLESWSSEYYFLISSAQIFKILVPSYYPFSYCVLLVPWLSVSLVHLHFDASNITLRIILIVVVVQ